MSTIGTRIHGTNGTYDPNSAKLATFSYVNGAQTDFSLNFYYQQNSANCQNAPTANDGQIQCTKDNVDAGRSIT
jgi:hypothetical protein